MRFTTKLLFNWNAAWFCVAMAFTGCSSADPEIENLLARELQVASPEVEAKRSGLKRLLNAFQEGAKEPADLQFSAGNIRFQQPIPDFYNGHSRLVAWQFVGNPEKDTHQVELHFDNKDFGPIEGPSLTKEVRSYRVSNSGSYLTVREVR